MLDCGILDGYFRNDKIIYSRRLCCHSTFRDFFLPKTILIMNTQFSKNAFLVLCLLFAFTMSLNAQRPVAKQKSSTTELKRDVEKKRISDADRKAIIELFKGVDQSKYRLQFYNGERKTPAKYGRLSYQMNDLQRVKRITNPVDAVGWIVFVVEGDDVIYVLAVGSDKLKSVLGAEKVKRLNAIMAKYQ